MPSGYPHSRAVRWRLFEQVCRGVPLWRAAQDMGVSTTAAFIWWRHAGAMKLVGGRGGGLADPGNMSLPGGQGHRLSLDERIVIMRGLDAGISYAKIGRRIGRDRITIWREVGRNRNPACASIEAWMDDGWSPKLIAQMLARDHDDDRLSRVSHETIYKCLYVQTRGSLRADLHQCLSTKRAARKPRGRIDNRRGAYSSGEEFRISDRPAEVADRAVPGHWEGDLIVGRNNSAIGTLVERST